MRRSWSDRKRLRPVVGRDNLVSSVDQGELRDVEHIRLILDQQNGSRPSIQLPNSRRASLVLVSAPSDRSRGKNKETTVPFPGVLRRLAEPLDCLANP